MYERGDIAQRIIDIPAEETWFSFPEVVDAEGRQGKFAKTWKYLSRKLDLPEKFCRLDRAAGLGRYAVALIGVRDGRALSSPLGKIKSPDDVLFISVFAEGSANFGAAVDDVKSPLYGKPEMYRLDLSRTAWSNANSDLVGAWPGQTTSGFLPTSKGRQAFSNDTHTSRILHFADGRLESDLFGMPRLKAVFNRLFDLAKVVGGSAETYWLVANKGLHANIDPSKVRGYKQKDLDALSDQMEQYRDQTLRVLKTVGVDIKDLGSDGSGVNPAGVFRVVAAIICGTTGIPVRMLFPETRGAQTSIYDRIAFREEKILPRQLRSAEPQIVRPFIDRMVAIGGMPKPVGIDGIPGNYNVLWPDPVSRSAADQADIAEKRSIAVSNLAKARSVGTPINPRQEQRILGFTEDGDDQDLPADLPGGDVVEETGAPPNEVNPTPPTSKPDVPMVVSE